eukprot:7380020-Prymnesium_polylepis.1
MFCDTGILHLFGPLAVHVEDAAGRRAAREKPCDRRARRQRVRVSLAPPPSPGCAPRFGPASSAAASSWRSSRATAPGSSSRRAVGHAVDERGAAPRARRCEGPSPWPRAGQRQRSLRRRVATWVG